MISPMIWQTFVIEPKIFCYSQIAGCKSIRLLTCNLGDNIRYPSTGNLHFVSKQSTFDFEVKKKTWFVGSWGSGLTWAPRRSAFMKGIPPHGLERSVFGSKTFAQSLCGVLGGFGSLFVDAPAVISSSSIHPDHPVRFEGRKLWPFFCWGHVEYVGPHPGHKDRRGDARSENWRRVCCAPWRKCHGE